MNEARVPPPELVGSEAESLGEAGAEALHEDVRSIDQPEHDVAAARVAQRHRERTLVGVHREDHRTLSVPERRSPRAPVVARVRPLDLDDIGPQHPEDLRAVGAGDRRRHVDDAGAGEGEERHRGIIAVAPL